MIFFHSSRPVSYSPVANHNSTIWGISAPLSSRKVTAFSYCPVLRNSEKSSFAFKDKNANVVFSAKQLNSKEVDDVRTQLAILDSIVLSDNPKARSKEFIQIATYLADEYKISNITGNNLSLIIPNVEGGVQTRRRV